MKKIALCSTVAITLGGFCVNSFAYVTPGMELIPYSGGGAVVPYVGGGAVATTGGGAVATGGGALTAVAPVAVAAATVVVAGAAVAGANALSNWNSDCSVGSLTYETVAGQSVQAPDDNEYLYVSQTDYNTAKTEFKKHSNSGNGKGYECDGAGARQCKPGNIVFMKAGHVFKGSRVTQAHKYKCQVDFWGDDYWEDLGVVTEPKKEIVCEINGQKVKPGDYLPVPCSESNYADIRTGKDCRVYCLQRGQDFFKIYGIEKCPKNYEGANYVDFSRYTPKVAAKLYGKCAKSQSPVKPGFCEQRKKWPKRYACCIAGNATEWKGEDFSDNGTCVCKDKAKEWNGKQCVANQSCEEQYKGNDEAIACCKKDNATWDSELNRCICEDDKEWSWDKEKKTGECKDSNSNGGSELTDCIYTLNMNIQCNNGNSFAKNTVKSLTKAEVEQFGGCDTFKAKVSKLVGVPSVEEELDLYQKLIMMVCGSNGGGYVANININATGGNNQASGPSAAEIKSAQDKLSAFFTRAESEASVWKDSEGNFNKARLASDATAGVVLGTVGGVVSSKIIKKKQLEKGYEVLHCTVGGHIVGGWGDEFSVGLLNR